MAPLSTGSDPFALLAVLAVLTLLPFAFATLTAFVKISTVLAIARSALGVPNVPSNLVLMALSAALTLVAMAPVGVRAAAALEPLLAAEAEGTTWERVQAGARAIEPPLRGFLERHAAPDELARFRALVAESSREICRPGASDTPPDPALCDPTSDTPAPWLALIPAFIVSELAAAFALGFAIYLPFLVIDLVTANVLLSLGMQMMTPTQVSLPFKLLLFVAVDGWGLLATALVGPYLAG